MTSVEARGWPPGGPELDDRPATRTWRDRGVDAVCVLVAAFVGLSALGIVADEDPSPPAELWLNVDFVTGCLACLALWWRRRWPVILALVVLPMCVVSAMATGAALVLIFTVAAYRRTSVGVAVTAAYVLTTPAHHLVRARTDLPYHGPGLVLVLIYVAAAALGMYAGTRRQLLWSLWERARRAEAEQQQHIVHARHLERTRIAREMHDVLAHRLSLLSMHAGALEFRPDASAEQIARAAGVVRENAHQALQDLREVIGVLREDLDGDGARPQPTLGDLPALVDESRRAGMTIRTDYKLADLSTVPVATGRTAYRIAQEGLTNARKHAAGSAVALVVAGAAGSGLSVEIRSQRPVVGDPVPAIPGGGTGLVGLAERASLAGGRLEHGRTAAGDFRLAAWLPWST
jgi:signal transduction histidine kinase